LAGIRVQLRSVITVKLSAPAILLNSSSWRLFPQPFILSAQPFQLGLIFIDLALLVILPLFLTHELVTN
jgi:hypothetical protein